AARPRSDLDARRCAREHLAPWRIAPWLDCVMTAHVLVPAFGEGPASLAPWSRPLLDRAVGGSFHGLVITDALDMAAVTAAPGDGAAAVRAIEAGADLLCLGTSLRRDDQQMLREAHDALSAAVAEGRLTRETLRDRAGRTRERLRSLRTRRRFVPAPPLQGALRHAEHGRHAHLDPGPAVVLDLRRRAQHASGARGQQLVTALQERGVQAEEADPSGQSEQGGPLGIPAAPDIPDAPGAPGSPHSPL